jgi:hypothetical protein
MVANSSGQYRAKIRRMFTMVLELDSSMYQPPASHEILVAPMVPDSCFDSVIFAGMCSHYPLGIGAVFAPDSGENFRGII